MVPEVLCTDVIGGSHVTKDVQGLMNALRQCINEAIMESEGVAAAVAALKGTGKCPLLMIDVALEEAPQPVASPVEESSLAGQLALTGPDMDFLRSLGIALYRTNEVSTA